jgi:DNA repair ATPase RecN
MNRTYLWWLFGVMIFVLSLWLLSLFLLFNAEMFLSSEIQFLSVTSAIGDSFGTLNSLFTGLALAAIVVAIFMQAKQLDEQVKANELYKKEVSATLDNLERENSWKVVESKMNLIPLLCDTYTRQLTLLAINLKTRSLKDINVAELYNDSEAIDRVCEKIDKHEAIMQQKRNILNDRMLQFQNDHKELSARLEEIKNDDGDMSDLQKTYGELFLKLVDESKSVKSELAKHDADEELVASIRDVVSNIRKLNQEYDAAFQKAYQMTR